MAQAITTMVAKKSTAVSGTASIAEVRALYQRDRERQEADCPHRPRRVGWARIDTGGSALLAGALQSKEGHALTPAQKVMHYEAWK
jgi:hypothetical protein